MLEHLFGSKTRLKLLKTFFRKSDSAFYVRELTRLLDAQINAIRRELDILLRTGLIKEIKALNKKEAEGASRLRRYYILNKESILYPEMHALIVKAQVLGEQKFSNEIIAKAGDIKLFVLTGQFTCDKNAPSDMLLVGKIKEMTIMKIIKNYEKELGFEIRYTLMTENEFSDRRNVMDKFLFSMFEVGHIKIVNKFGV